MKCQCSEECNNSLRIYDHNEIAVAFEITPGILAQIQACYKLGMKFERAIILDDEMKEALINSLKLGD